MQQSFNDVKSLLDDVAPFLVRAGVSSKSCSMPSGEIHLLGGQKFIDAFDMLSALVISTEWLEVQDAWKLVPPATWASYEMFEITGLQEQIILARALSKLKKYWTVNKISGFFGKVIDVPELVNEGCTEGGPGGSPSGESHPESSQGPAEEVASD